MGNKQQKTYPPSPFGAHGTVQFETKCRERECVRIPAHAHITYCRFEVLNGSRGKDGLRIVREKHFKQGNARDIILWASTEWFGDPWARKPKQLVVRYTLPNGWTVPRPNEHVKEFKIQEDQWIAIPQDVTVMTARWAKIHQNGKRKDKDVTKIVQELAAVRRGSVFCANSQRFGKIWGGSKHVLEIKVSEPIRVFKPQEVTVPIITSTFVVTNDEVSAKKSMDSWVTSAEVVKNTTTTTSAPIQATPIQATPIQATPVQATPVQATPVQATPVQATPVQATSVQATSNQATPVQTTPVQATPVQATPVQATPVQATPVQATTVQATPVQASSVQVTPVQATPVQATPVQATETTVQTTPVTATAVTATAPSAPQME